MQTVSLPLEERTKEARNEIAAILTIVPGLGHIYKGHYTAGLGWMFLGTPIALWVGILFSLATAGLGLLFPIGCWAVLAIDAYYRKDLRRHHALPPVDEIHAIEQD